MPPNEVVVLNVLEHTLVVSIGGRQARKKMRVGGECEKETREETCERLGWIRSEKGMRRGNEKVGL